MTQQDHPMPSDHDIAAAIQHAREFMAKMAEIPPEKRRPVTNPKFYGAIGDVESSDGARPDLAPTQLDATATAWTGPLMGPRNLGFYRELPYGDATGTSITEQMRLDPATKQRVLHYLESAPILAASQQVFTDYFTGEVVDRLHLHTDGEWQWYSDLPYYVRTHDSVLDPEFLSAIDGRSEAQVSPEDLVRIADDLFSAAPPQEP